MKNKLEPNWHPISMLPIIVDLIDNQFKDMKGQYENLLQVRSKPYVLDDATILRTIKAYTEQLDFLWVFEKQIAKWQEESSLTCIQESELDRVENDLKQFRKTLVNLLDLTDELKEGTIEKVMAKSDIDLGLEFLKSK
ncbi:hypothetical protein [Marinisporobacter balticus]|uniref:Uncharacterized protein n=1 Tax=Marinisporobacter balticus TaxID=2018667 RepID=A0A4R2K7X8_9FIRM|nr:hypothetical protein [Marinisporobacter balticus]TCO69481.1 hypothetical protein EV214_1315 [Marinisporobacter balticus]